MTKKEAKIVKGLMEKPRKEWVQLSPCAPWHGSVYALYRDGYVVCRSYDTAIAMLTPKCEVVRLWDGYSKTSYGASFDMVHEISSSHYQRKNMG